MARPSAPKPRAMPNTGRNQPESNPGRSEAEGNPQGSATPERHATITRVTSGSIPGVPSQVAGANPGGLHGSRISHPNADNSFTERIPERDGA